MTGIHVPIIAHIIFEIDLIEKPGLDVSRLEQCSGRHDDRIGAGIAEFGASNALERQGPRVPLAFAGHPTDIDAAELIPPSVARIQSKQTLRRISPEQMRGYVLKGATAPAADHAVDLGSVLSAQWNRQGALRSIEAAASDRAAKAVDLAIDAVDRRRKVCKWRRCAQIRGARLESGQQYTPDKARKHRRSQQYAP